MAVTSQAIMASAIISTSTVCSTAYSDWQHYHSTSSVWGESTGTRFNIKMSSYQYRKYHCGDKTVVRLSYFHNGISYTGKMTSLYWIRALVTSGFSLSQRASNAENVLTSWYNYVSESWTICEGLGPCVTPLKWHNGSIWEISCLCLCRGNVVHWKTMFYTHINIWCLYGYKYFKTTRGHWKL